MGIEDKMQNKSTYSAFRTSLDIAMGAIYIILGFVVFTMKNFGTIVLPPTTSYILGGVMLLYGGFRIYRGIVEMRRRKDYQHHSDSN